MWQAHSGSAGRMQLHCQWLLVAMRAVSFLLGGAVPLCTVAMKIIKHKLTIFLGIHFAPAIIKFNFCEINYISQDS